MKSKPISTWYFKRGEQYWIAVCNHWKLVCDKPRKLSIERGEDCPYISLSYRGKHIQILVDLYSRRFKEEYEKWQIGEGYY